MSRLTPDDLELLAAMAVTCEGAGYVIGVDLASGPDQMVLGCSCGFETNMIDALVDHLLDDHHVLVQP